MSDKIRTLAARRACFRAALGWCYLLGLAWLALPGELSAGSPAEEIPALIGQLAAPRFVERELATERLIELGLPAVEPLESILPRAKHETVARALHVLKQMSVSSDEEAQNAAVAALERLAAAPETVIGQKAVATLASIETFRQERALAELKLAGAIVKEGGAVTRNGPAARQIMLDVTSLIIGPDWTGGDAELRHLRWAVDINHVVLTGPSITDKQIEAVKAMPGLEYLEIKRAKIGDAALGKLRGIKQLQLLSVYYTPVSNASLDLLKSLQGIGEIRLYGTEVTEDAAGQLEAALVGTFVDFKRGAFVGIGSQLGGFDCTVSTVMEKSAADKAGVQLGDIVVGYDGEPVTDFESLRKLIQRNKAGDKVEIVVRRDGELLTKTLELGEWE